MNWMGNLFGGAAAQPIEAVGEVVDSLFTSEEEKLDKQIIMQRLRQQPHLLQAMITQTEAQHRSVFVAGWRPAIGWVCAIGLGYTFVVNPIIQWQTGTAGPSLDTEALMTLVISLLGLGSLRTVEKLAGRAK